MPRKKPEDERPTWQAYVIELMKINNWTEEQLATEVGVHHTSVSKWKNGRAKPSAAAQKTLLKLGNRA